MSDASFRLWSSPTIAMGIVLGIDAMAFPNLQKAIVLGGSYS
ncbi:hypothetical protein [Bifidobacterium aquikefiri]|nr:hypothetical protein [Bifidobacterium aquikefiri]